MENIEKYRNILGISSKKTADAINKIGEEKVLEILNKLNKENGDNKIPLPELMFEKRIKMIDSKPNNDKSYGIDSVLELANIYGNEKVKQASLTAKELCDLMHIEKSKEEVTEILLKYEKKSSIETLDRKVEKLIKEMENNYKSIIDTSQKNFTEITESGVKTLNESFTKSIEDNTEKLAKKLDIHFEKVKANLDEEITRTVQRELNKMVKAHEEQQEDDERNVSKKVLKNISLLVAMIPMIFAGGYVFGWLVPLNTWNQLSSVCLLALGLVIGLGLSFLLFSAIYNKNYVIRRVKINNY